MSKHRKPTRRVDQDELTRQWLGKVLAVCMILLFDWIVAWCLVTM